MKLEICVDSYESLLNAKNAGADRIELCSSLQLDGLTPSIGLISMAEVMEDIEVFAMIRPRAGDFCYTDLEFEMMREEILNLKGRNIDGFVIGILKEDATLDLDRMRELIELSYPKPVSLHRAFDFSKDGQNHIEDLIDMGIIRILTSGKKEKAIDGLELISVLNEKYGDKIEIMAGSGLNSENIPLIYEKTKINNFHLSGRHKKESAMIYTPDFGYTNDDIYITSFENVKDSRKALDNLLKNK